jgi:hypothetical protein
MSNRDKDRFTAAVPTEIKSVLDEVAEARGTHRSGAVVQVVQEWDEREEEIEKLRDELDEVREDRARLSAQLEEAEERASDDRAPWTVRMAWRLLSVTLLALGSASVALGLATGGVTLGAVTPAAWAVAGGLAAVVGVTASAGTVAFALGKLAYQVVLGDADDALAETVETFRSDLERGARR